jgi:hypothetical protein
LTVTLKNKIKFFSSLILKNFQKKAKYTRDQKASEHKNAQVEVGVEGAIVSCYEAL